MINKQTVFVLKTILCETIILMKMSSEFSLQEMRSLQMENSSEISLYFIVLLTQGKRKRNYRVVKE